MSSITYDPDYCPEAPYIYYHMDDDGYMLGGEYKTLKEASAAKRELEAEHGPCKFKERME